jgi:hypothetical protein
VRFFVAVSIVCTLAAPVEAEQAAPLQVGQWRGLSDTDTMTDETGFMIVNRSAVSEDAAAPASLMISCDDDGALRTHLLLTEGSWYSTLGSGYLIAVTHRIDGGKPVRNHWYFSRGGQSANALSADLVKALRRGAQVRFRVSSYESDHEAVFDLQGTDQAVGLLERACARKRPAGRKGSGKR